MHDGWVRLKDISIRGSGAAGGGCCGAAMEKTLDARACLTPRGALAFAFSSHFQTPRYTNRFRAPGISSHSSGGGPGGSPAHFRRLSPFALFVSDSAPPESPDTRHHHQRLPTWRRPHGHVHHTTFIKFWLLLLLLLLFVCVCVSLPRIFF